MINVSKYEWLDTTYDFDSVKEQETDVRVVLSYIHKRDWEDGKKKAVFAYFFNQVKEGKVKSFKNEKEVGKYIKNLTSSSDYLNVANESTKKDKRSFTVYGIGLAFAFTAFLYCAFGAIRKDNPINPTIQIVVAVVALAVSAWTYRKRYDILLKYSDEKSTYMMHDLIFVGVAILCKLIGKTVLDLTIILMGLDVYFTSKEFNETIDKVLK